MAACYQECNCCSRGNGPYNSPLKQKLKLALLDIGVCSNRPWLYLGLLAVLLALAGCQVERRKSDAELGLNATQAAGRHIFDRQCGGCHEAYSSRPLKGPSVEGLFKHTYMKNGMPANDDRVREIIVYGRSKMPSFGRSLTPEQVDELMAYLHTL